MEPLVIMGVITFVAIAVSVMVYIAANKNCRHSFAKKQKDGCQYCIKCGAARDPFCFHKWETKSSSDITVTNHLGKKIIKGTLYILTCTKCGDLKHHEASLADKE